jgi:hypothetical protein
VADRDPSCVDEKRALERARRRVETAQRKIAAVHHWAMAIERAADDFRRARTQFATWLDIDLAQAIVTLNQMSEALVTYITMKSPDGAVESPEESPAATSDKEDAAAKEPETP